MRRVSLLLLILLALVLSPAAAFAQDSGTPVPCGNLSDEDCDFLHASREATKALTSQSMEFSMEMALSNAPGLPSDLGIAMQVSGSFSGDPELNARMAEMQSVAADAEDPAAFLVEFMDVAAEFYAVTVADMTFSMQISNELADLLAATGGLPFPQAIELPMRLVDGIAFTDLSQMTDVMGMEPMGWVGVDMVDAIEQSAEQSAAQLQAGAMGDVAGMSSMMSSSMAGFGAGSMLGGSFVDFTGVERLEDSEVDGVPVARFLYTFDLAGFVSSPEFIELLTQQAEAQMAMAEAAGAEQSLSEEDLGMITMALPMFAPMLFADLQWETLSSIGLEDGLVRASETTVVWDLTQLTSVAAMVMDAPAERPNRGAEGGLFTLSIQSRSSDFDAEVTVEAPEGAIMVPTDEMTGASM